MISALRMSDAAAYLSATLVGEDCNYTGVSTDTRTLEAGDLFVAITGPHFDGHDYVTKACELGAVGVVVERDIAQRELAERGQSSSVPQLRVQDSRRALGLLGRMNRDHYRNPLVAITGSSGKTTVKEMLATIVSQASGSGQKNTVLATQGNLNNEIGVPLTLLRLDSTHQYAVVELGANAQGEIGYTASLAQPDVAILTNASGAHLEGFGSLEGVVQAKAEIFSGLKSGGWGVVNRDDPHAESWLALLKDQHYLTFSRKKTNANLFATDIQVRRDGCYRFVLNCGRDQVAVQLEVMGEHAIDNALAAACGSVALGIGLEQIAAGLETFGPVPGRLTRDVTARGFSVIDDTYNANPASVQAAIQTLRALEGYRVLILGDMAELGPEGAALHREVGILAAAAGVECLLTVGSQSGLATQAYLDEEGGRGRAFTSKKDLYEWLGRELTSQMVLLVKGSRSARMEEVVKMLIEEGNR